MKLAILIVLAALAAAGPPAPASEARATMELQCHYNAPPRERCTFSGCDDAAAAGDGE